MAITTTIKKLKAQFPTLDVVPSEEFDGTEGGLWFKNSTEVESGGYPLFNYYTEDHQEKVYVMGIHRRLGAVLEEAGMFGEPHDSETLMAWES